MVVRYDSSVGKLDVVFGFMMVFVVGIVFVVLLVGCVLLIGCVRLRSDWWLFIVFICCLLLDYDLDFIVISLNVVFRFVEFFVCLVCLGV